MATTKVLTVQNGKGEKKNVKVYPPKFNDVAKQEFELLNKLASDDQTFTLEDVEVYEKPTSKREGAKKGRSKVESKS